MTLVGLAGVLALSAGAVPASAAPGTGNNTTTNLLYSVNGGAWTDSPVAERGDTVTARLFYDTTREDTLTGVSLTSQIPEGFSYVAGSTRNVLAPGTDVLTGAVSGETKASPVADSVWSGDTITVSPSAGFNGEPNSSQSGFLRNGVKRYVNLENCFYSELPSAGEWFAWSVDRGASTWSAGTNASNTARTTANCAPGTDTRPLGVTAVQALDLLGNRYVNLENCFYADRAGTGEWFAWSVDRGASTWSAGTDASNTARTTTNCAPGTDAQPLGPSAVQPLDLLDTARGQGFIEFRMTSEVQEAPACGETVTEPELVSDREGTMTGTGTGTPTSTATVTLAEYTATGEECAEVVLVDDQASTIDDTPVDIDVQDNDTIPDGSTGWEVDSTTSKGGTVVDNGDGTVTYTRPPGFHGTDTFTYRVTGPDGVEYEATVTVTVTDEDGNTPMIAPGMAAVTLLGAGLLTAVRRRRTA